MTKKIFILVGLLFVSFPAFAQVDTTWVRRYNGPTNQNDLATALAVDDSGNVYVTGYSDGAGTYQDYATIKYYPNGDTAWVRRYNGPGDSTDYASAIAVDDFGNAYVTGASYDSGTYYDYATIKYYPNGDTAWVRRYNGPGGFWGWASAIVVDAWGNVYVTGYSSDSVGWIKIDYCTIKYYSNGDTAWVRRYSSGDANYAHDMAIDDSGYVYVTGQSAYDYATIKYYSNGDTAWVRRYDTPGHKNDGASAIAVDDSGNVYVTGFSFVTLISSYTTIKYYHNGDTAWVRRYKGPGDDNDGGSAIAVDGSGNVYVTGTSGGIGTYYDDYATIKYYPNGDTAWVRRYNYAADYAYDMVIDDSGNVYVTGQSGYTYIPDYATIKYYTNGDIAWVRRYNGPGNSWDKASAIAVDDFGNVYVTGYSWGSETAYDYATIRYTPFLKANFSGSPRCGYRPLSVQFTELSTGGPTTWYWDFGDGNTSMLQNPIHTYTDRGYFDVKLTVSDSMFTDIIVKPNYIAVFDTLDSGLSVDFIGLPSSGKPRLTVMFEPILGGIVTHYFWDFGDGDTSSLRNPIHRYNTRGKYDVKLKGRLVLDNCNLVDSLIKEDYIIVNDLEAKFSASPTAGVAPCTVQFTDESTGDPTTWFWNFGDGDLSTVQHPQHRYDTAGIYDVFLRVGNDIGVDSLLKLSYIRIADPYVDLVTAMVIPGLRPGFMFIFYVYWTNIGTIPAENCTLRILLPSEAIFYDLFPGDIRTGTYSGYSLFGDTIIVPLGTIHPSSWYGGYVWGNGYLPETVPIGDTLACKMWLTSSTPDQNYNNNHVLHRQTVIGSWDPNEKLAYPEGEGISHAIEPDQRLEYTIQFENKPEATAEAIYIRIVDTLDQDLDWGTLAIGPSSHPEKCSYEFDPYSGVIVWFCDSIMLPPNQNPPEGEGYFTFSISPTPGLPQGTEIANSAWIRFDYNPCLQAPEGGPVIRTIGYPFLYGDANGDGRINSADIVYLINYLFAGGPSPQPWQAGDANCDGKVNSADIVYLINYLFAGGPPPGC